MEQVSAMELVRAVVIRTLPAAEFEQLCALLCALGIDQIRSCFPELWRDMVNEVRGTRWREERNVATP